jgi:hypothetical protein
MNNVGRIEHPPGVETRSPDKKEEETERIRDVVHQFGVFCDHDLSVFKPVSTSRSMTDKWRCDVYFSKLLYEQERDRVRLMSMLSASYAHINEHTMIDIHRGTENNLNRVIIYDHKKLLVAITAMQLVGIRVHRIQDVLDIIRHIAMDANSKDVIHVVFGDAMKDGVVVSRRVRQCMIQIAFLSFS